MKVAKESWLLSLVKKSETLLFYFLILFLPTQFGKHFWPPFSYVLGQRVDYLSPTVYLTDIFIVILFLFCSLQKRIFVHPFLSFLFLYLSLGIFFSSSPIIGWYFLLKFLEICFLIWYVAKKAIINTKVGVLLAIGILFEVLLVLLQFIHHGSLGGLLYFLGERAFSSSTPGVANASIQGQLILRPYGTFSHPNMLAGYLLVAMLLVLFLLRSQKSFLPKIIFYIAALGIFLSLSRSAVFTLLLAGIITLSQKGLSKKSLLVLSFFLSLVLLFFLLFPDTFFRLISFPGISLTERSQLIIIALNLTKTHPVFGVGLGNFIPSLSFFATSLLQPVHNIYLLTAAETGIIGLIFFCWFLITLWNKQNKSSSFFLKVAFLSILLLGFFDHYFLTLQQGQLLFALAIGLMSRDTIQK